MNVAINSNLNALEPTPIGQFVKTVTAAGTAERLVATSTYFRKAIILGKKDYRTDNAGVVYLGASGTGTNQPYAVSPGDVIFFELPVGARDDFYNWWANPATDAGDGVVVIYW